MQILVEMEVKWKIIILAMAYLPCFIGAEASKALTEDVKKFSIQATKTGKLKECSRHQSLNCAWKPREFKITKPFLDYRQNQRLKPSESGKIRQFKNYPGQLYHSNSKGEENILPRIIYLKNYKSWKHTENNRKEREYLRNYNLPEEERGGRKRSRKKENRNKEEGKRKKSKREEYESSEESKEESSEEEEENEERRRRKHYPKTKYYRPVYRNREKSISSEEEEPRFRKGKKRKHHHRHGWHWYNNEDHVGWLWHPPEENKEDIWQEHDNYRD